MKLTLTTLVTLVPFAVSRYISPRAAPVNQLTGYAAGTTGGGAATPIVATSCVALTTAVGASGASVIQLRTLISGCGIMNVTSNKTIIGVGSSAGLQGGGFRLIDASNIIIRNLHFWTGVPAIGVDLISLERATRVWIDHNDISAFGIVGDEDLYDGLLDITHGSDLVTVSWNTFHDHWKGSLIGDSDSNGDEDIGHLRVTYHHNLWVNINARLPSIRFGTGHMYNSIYTSIPTSGINSRMGAQVLVENSIFNEVTLAIVTDLDSEEEGFAVQRNNVFNASTTRITQTGIFPVPYSYTLDSTAELPRILSASAGVGKIA